MLAVGISGIDVDSSRIKVVQETLVEFRRGKRGYADLCAVQGKAMVVMAGDHV